MSSEYVWKDKSGKLYREEDLTDEHIRNIVKCIADGRLLKPSEDMEKVLDIALERGMTFSDKVMKNACFYIAAADNLLG